MKKLNLIFFISIIAFIFVWINTPLIDEDEGLMAEISREMLETGDFISPRMNGELRFDKPPFFNWLQVVSFYFFGLNQFAARLPAVIFGGFWFFFTFKIAESTSTLKSKIEPNSLIYLFFCSFQIVILSMAGIQESVNDSCFCAIIYFLFFNKYSQLYLRKIYISTFLSISFLTKGPLVFGLILIIVFFKYLMDKFYKNQQGEEQNYLPIKVFFSFQTLLIFFLLTSPWYIFMFQKYGFDFIEGFFLRHNLNRFLITKESHSGSFFYYIIILFVGNIAILPAIIHSLSLEFKRKNNAILLIILFATILFFSFSATKLHHYTVIAYPALIALVFKHQNSVNLAKSYRVFLVFKFFFFSSLLVLYFYQSFIKDDYSRAVLMDTKIEIIQFLVIVFILILLNLFFEKYNKIIYLGFINLLFSLSFFYFVGNAMQKPIQEMAKRIKSENLDLKTMSHYQPSLSFYSNRVIKMGEESVAKYIFGKRSELKNQKGNLIFSQSGFELIEKK